MNTGTTPPLTHHAGVRASQRGLNIDAINAAIRHGTCHRLPGTRLFVLGRRDVERLGSLGRDLAAFENVHVVCDAREGTVITVYRNRDLRRGRRWKWARRRRERRHS